MKRIVFLIIATLLVLGLVLPGCADGGAIEWPIKTLKTAGTLTIGVTGAMGYDQGLHAAWGAELAKDTIGTFTVGTKSLTVTIKRVETDEVLNPGSASGTAAVAAAVGSCDFMVGGFRTEGVVVYREPIMSANMTFINCGASTEMLCNSVLTDYNRYKWFFKGTPPNDWLVSVFQGKIFAEVAYAATVGMAMQGKAFVPKIALLVEDAEWTRESRDLAQAKFNFLGYSVRSTPWMVLPLATDLTSTLNSINATSPNLIYTILSGPVGMTYAKQVGGIMPNVQSVGTNVEAQRQQFGTEATYAEGMVFTDGWAPGVDLTGNTAAFLTDFAAAHGGQWPIYTAGTYDAVGTLVEALQSEGYVDGGVVKYAPLDIVAYMEASQRTTGVGATKVGVYPKWNGAMYGNFTPGYGSPPTLNLPALTEAQVQALYPWLDGKVLFSGGPSVIYNWTYNPDQWTMGPHTTHDLIFGREWTVGTGSQWQYDGGGPLKKVCVWPKTLLPYPSDQASWITYLGTGAVNASSLYTIQFILGMWDQYGWYNFEYPGTGSLNLTKWITWMVSIAP